jgi:hypothetical protein
MKKDWFRLSYQYCEIKMLFLTIFFFSYNLRSYEKERDDKEELWRKRVCDNRMYVFGGGIEIQPNCQPILLAIWAWNCEMALLGLTYPDKCSGSRDLLGQACLIRGSLIIA